MHRMTEFVSRRSLLAGAAATLAAPALLRAQPAAIKIGLIHPVTGALAYGGQLCRIGGQTAIDEVNAAGGIASMAGAKLEAVLGDAQSKPEIGASLVDQMNEAGVAGFTGCFASAIGLAATQAAAKYNVPFCIDSGIADSLTTRGLKNVFRLFPTASGTGSDALAALDGINKGAGSPAKTAILVHEDSEFGANTAKSLAPKLETIGIRVLEIIPHATPTRDFTNIVLRIKAAKPDLVIPTDYNNEYILLNRTLVQQKVDLMGVFSVAGGGFNLRFAKEQAQVAQGIIDVNHWLNPRADGAAAFRKKFDDKNATFGFEVLFGYFAVRFMADAMERAGSADKEKLIAALGSSTYRPDLLPYGPTKIVDGQNQNAHAVALQIQDGDIKVVSPEQYADAKVVFPRAKV